MQSLYKSLMISERTTAQGVIQLLLNCYDSDDSPSSYSLYEVSFGVGGDGDGVTATDNGISDVKHCHHVVQTDLNTL